MEFKDWRKAPAQPAEGTNAPRKPRGKRFTDYIEEQIREAQERGAFDNLRGAGQPLHLDTNPYAGENALGYSLLKNNGYVPAEIELAREIRQEQERLNRLRESLAQRGQHLRHRHMAPFASEKRAYNNAVTHALNEYESKLRELNRKILTLNLTAPASMHHVPLNIEHMLGEFRATCPLFA